MGLNLYHSWTSKQHCRPFQTPEVHYISHNICSVMKRWYVVPSHNGTPFNGYMNPINGLMTIPQYGYQVHLMTILWPWHTWPNTTGDSYRDQPRKKHCSLDWEPCQWDTQHDKNSYMLIPERQMIHITHQSGNSQVYIWEIQVSHIETFWESLLHCSDRFWKDFLFSLVHWPPSSGDMEPCFPCHHGRTHWS